METPIHELQTVLLLLLSFVILFALLARRLNVPYPILLVLGGLLLAFVPAVPDITLDPDIIFLVVLPPLLYSAAWNTPWREFRHNLVSISMLAFGLVGFTVLGVTLAASRVLKGFDWQLGFVLGAVVATTDAIAATSIAKRIGLPHGIVDLLEGESLLNDATGLLALEFGTSIVVYGHMPSIGSGLVRLTWLIAGGLVVGIVIGYLVDLFERHVEYGSIEIMLSLLVPYATYLAAEAIHSSGVLSVVACGLFLSRRSAEFYSPKVRLQSTAVWSSLSFTLNGLTFILIGLQLPTIRAGIKGQNMSGLLIDGAVFSGLLIVLRLLWVFPSSFIANAVRRRVLRERVPALSRRQVFVVGWTGMRGVIALAAALSLPEALANGSAFPQRDMIVFLTFSVILVTLVFQGLTLPGIIRFLRLAGSADSNTEENDARKAILEAALAYLHDSRGKDASHLNGLYDRTIAQYRYRLEEVLDQEAENAEVMPTELGRYRELSRHLIKIERETAIRLRNRGKISDDVLRRLERELDLNEAHLSTQKPWS